MLRRLCPNMKSFRGLFERNVDIDDSSSLLVTETIITKLVVIFLPHSVNMKPALSKFFLSFLVLLMLKDLQSVPLFAALNWSLLHFLYRIRQAPNKPKLPRQQPL